MRIDLSFGRVVFWISTPKTSFLWKKNNDKYFFHIGTFGNDAVIATEIIILCFCINIGIIPK
jgi:hypothetical protein